MALDRTMDPSRCMVFTGDNGDGGRVILGVYELRVYESKESAVLNLR